MQDPAIRTLLTHLLYLRNEGRISELVPEMISAVQEHPDAAGIVGLWGEVVFEDLGDMEESVKIFTRVLILSPYSRRASIRLFSALWDLGHFDKALDEVKRYCLITQDLKTYADIIEELPEKDKKIFQAAGIIIPGSG